MSKKRKKSYNIAERGSAATVKPDAPVRKSTGFDPDYSYVIKDLKRIAILAGSFLVLMIALSFVLN